MNLALSTMGVGVADGLSFSTDAVLPPLRLREVLRPEVLATDALELLTNIREVLARAESVLNARTTTGRDLRQLQADLQGNLEALAAFRDDLDGWRAIDALPVVDGAVLIRVWEWERSLRRALIGLAAQLKTVADQAAELASGHAERVVLIRSGDTWQKLAQVHLGDWRAWRTLVDHNAADPTGPTPGALIAIPAT